jgi:hypothetical protein
VTSARIGRMRISLGIFAYNEAARIGATLASLRSQDLFAATDRDIEIVVLPNGCRDNTAAVAQEALATLFSGLPGVRARVENLPEPGKSRTWNRYVHELADPAADVLVFMDGDISLVGEATLRLLVEALVAHPEAHASVDVILKDIAFKQNLTAREKMSLAASELTRSGPPKLAGSFYAVRGLVVRGIWMPVGLLVEDGFLKAMLCTDNFTAPDNPARLVRAEGAAHTFEAVTDLRTLFKHEVRLLVGSAMNFILFEELTREVAATGRDAGALVGAWNREGLDWPAKRIDQRLSAQRGFLAPTGFILLPFRQLKHLPVMRALKRLPSAALRMLFNAAAAVAAHRQLKQRAFRW